MLAPSSLRRCAPFLLEKSCGAIERDDGRCDRRRRRNKGEVELALLVVKERLDQVGSGCRRSWDPRRGRISEGPRNA